MDDIIKEIMKKEQAICGSLLFVTSLCKTMCFWARLGKLYDKRTRTPEECRDVQQNHVEDTTIKINVEKCDEN